MERVASCEYGPALAKMLAAFPHAREKYNGWYVHDDNPRFDFRVRENGSIFIHSWTGRSEDEILSMRGLDCSDISPQGTYPGPTKDSLDLLDLAIAKCIHPHFLENLGLYSGYLYRGRHYVKIPYHLADGSEHTKVKVRKAVDGKYKHCWDEGTPGETIPYGLHKLGMSRDAGYLLIGEGESDGWALWYHGLPYLGIPGSNNHSCLKHIDVKALPSKIYILHEPDQVIKLLSSGIGFYKTVHNALRANGYQGEIFCIDFKKATGYDDPSELHVKLWPENQAERFNSVIQQAIATAIPANDAQVYLYSLPVIDNANQLTSEQLCSFTEDDAGNGDALFALFGQEFLYCPSRGWFVYVGTHWKLDVDGAAVKKCAVETLRRRRHAAVDLQKSLLSNVQRPMRVV